MGDQVLVQQKKWNKLTSKFKPKRYKIIAMITTCRKGYQITQNRSFFKIFRGHAHDDSSENDDDSGFSGGEDVAREDAPAAPDKPDVGPVENQNNPAEQERREANEPVEDHLQRKHSYPQRRIDRPLFYQDDQNDG